MDAGNWEFLRVREFSSTNPLFDSDGGPHYNDVEQGAAGTCYVHAALAAMAEFPELVTSMFISGQEISDKGIYNIRFFIRGKPWIVTIDDFLLAKGNGG